MLTLTAAAAALIGALHRIGHPPPDAALRLAQADFSATTDARWQPVTLPDDWRQGRADVTEAWYRFRLDLPAVPLRLAAVYLPTVAHNAALYLNGVEIGNGGRFTTPVSRHHPRPLLFAVSPDAFLPGPNELLLRVRSEQAGRGLLPAIYVGDRDALWPAYSRRHALKSTAPAAFGVIQVILAALLIAVSLYARRDSVYLWAGLTLLALAGHLLPALVTDIPMPPIAWELWQHLCIGGAAVFVTLFGNRFIGRPQPRWERLLWQLFAGLAAVSIIIAAGPDAWVEAYYRLGGAVWGAAAVAAGSVPLARITRHALEGPQIRSMLMAGAGALMVLLGAHDVLWVAGLMPREDGYLVHFGSPVASVIFTSVLFLQLAQTRTELEALNRHLEERIADKSAELARSHERLARLERTRALAEERQRFTRDMHDGLGGYLAGALALAERSTGEQSPLAALLRDATDEMRLMIDAAELDGQDPGFALGLLRPRLERQLAAAGIALAWTIEETAPWPGRGSRAVLSLMRIVQEATSNAVRHSGATRLAVTLRDTDDGTLLLRIEDDGRGFDDTGPCRSAGDPATRRGRGLANLRSRAAQLGGTFDVDAGPQGTCLTLRLPRKTGVDPGAH